MRDGWGEVQSEDIGRGVEKDRRQTGAMESFALLYKLEPDRRAEVAYEEHFIDISNCESEDHAYVQLLSGLVPRDPSISIKPEWPRQNPHRQRSDKTIHYNAGGKHSSRPSNGRFTTTGSKNLLLSTENAMLPRGITMLSSERKNRNPKYPAPNPSLHTSYPSLSHIA